MGESRGQQGKGGREVREEDREERGREEITGNLEMLVIPSLCCFSKTLHRILIKQSSLKSLGKGWWSLPRNMGGRWPQPPFMKFSRKSPRVWLFLWTQFLFFSSFLRSFPILVTIIVSSPPVSRVGITVLHRRIKCIGQSGR